MCRPPRPHWSGCARLQQEGALVKAIESRLGRPHLRSILLSDDPTKVLREADQQSATICNLANAEFCNAFQAQSQSHLE
jgi:hypothetical protein